MIMAADGRVIQTIAKRFGSTIDGHVSLSRRRAQRPHQRVFAILALLYLSAVAPTAI